MSTVSEVQTWNDIIDDEPGEREIYDEASLADYIDVAVLYYREAADRIDFKSDESMLEFLDELLRFMNEYAKTINDVKEVRIQGNGMYLPEETNALEFFNGTPGFSGEIDGFSIATLPTYPDVLNKKDGERAIQPILCLELVNCRYYTDTNIALEPTGESISIPLEHQDLCFTRPGSESAD